jgi:hypothetical protein
MSIPDPAREPLRPFDLVCYFYTENVSGASIYDEASPSGRQRGGSDKLASIAPFGRFAYWDPKSRRWCAWDG